MASSVRRSSAGEGGSRRSSFMGKQEWKSTPPNLGEGGCFSCFRRSCLTAPDARPVDALFIGGGIISMTTALMLKKLQPNWDIVVVERLGAVGEESSHGFSNAGTGHSGFCEPNYTPKVEKDGKMTVKLDKCIYACESFMAGRQFWSSLVKEGLLKSPESFIRSCPHIAFGPGSEKKETIQLRYEAMKKQPLFASMEYSEDHKVMTEWAPLVMEGRDPNQPCAMTFVREGTDVDFGALTKACTEAFIKLGGDLRLFSEVTDLKRYNISKEWRVTTRKCDAGRGYRLYRSKFVFVGAGGWSLPMLQMSGIDEIRGYNALSVDGEWAVCQNPAVVERHPIKVYAPGPVGAPPMSMPHIDARVIGGKKMLLFGPWCQWTPRFLKKGRRTDAFRVFKPHNIMPLATAGLKNLDLGVFLLRQMTTSYPMRFEEIKEYYPNADPDDWTFVPAAVRAQIVKRDGKSKICGALQFGTEVIKNADGDMCGLMGASPGASTCVQIALDVLRSCFPGKFQSWEADLKKMIPSFGTKLNDFRAYVPEVYAETALVLGLEKYDAEDAKNHVKVMDEELKALNKKKEALERQIKDIELKRSEKSAEIQSMDLARKASGLSPVG
mmetsp:Transcript_118540/g.215596  ORF Transcript_118540/g.215596 Transcript_118540/m.215596 type:complete len:609 (-) Transcript_118540:39-1865(-)